MLDVRVLGPIEARSDDEVIVLGSRAQRTLLAALVLARGRSVATSELVDLLWNGDPPATSHNALKSHVSRLRRSLRTDVVAAQPPGYALTVSPEQLDVHRFERGVPEADTVTEIDRLLAMWRGPPYGDMAAHEHFAGEVARLEELHARGRLRRAELLSTAGRVEEAAAAYTELVGGDPLREAAWIGLVRALHAAGRQADAVAEARRYREHASAVGLEPSPRFLEAEHELFTTAAPAVVTRRPSSAVPDRLASIVGRQRELEEVEGLLNRRRLVTLVGPGGVGKTTLALEAARHVGDDLRDGVWVVTLADIDDAASVVPAIVRAVGAPVREPLDRSLAHYLAGRQALLVVDNAEHVREAVRSVLPRLFAGAERLRVLVTGRQPLDVAGEVVVPVQPLDRQAAVELLNQRAHDAGAPIPSGQQELASEICDRLDRLPLAIEMAAARLRGLGLIDLAEHLDERLRLLHSAEGGRHETLATVVGWSYDLLDADGRSLLEQLSVFVGAFDLAAADAVCDVPDVTAGVADLVDRSLVYRIVDDGRAHFQLLETVRSFAVERSRATRTRRATLERFVRYHVDLAERIEAGLRGPDEAAWANLLDRQLPDLEAAHAHALQLEDVDAAVRIASAPFVFVYHRLRADVGAWADATLPLARRTDHPGTSAVAAVAALNRLHRGDLDGAGALLVDLPDEPVARHAHEVLGDLHTYRGELDAALEHFRRAERSARRADDRFTVLHSRGSQSIVLGYAGRVDDGLELVEAVRREAASERLAIASAWCDYAEGELLADAEPDRAVELVERAVEVADRAGWWMLAGVGRLTVSSLRARTVDPVDAIPGFERLIRHWEGLGDETHQWTTLRNLVELFVRLGAHAPAARLIGAVSRAPRPSFGAERERLEGAEQTVRRHLGDGADELLRSGRKDDLGAAVELASAALSELGSARPDGTRGSDAQDRAGDQEVDDQPGRVHQRGDDRR
jgi:predicted ATPase/DNA-binding SARP family transcriptional activator